MNKFSHSFTIFFFFILASLTCDAQEFNYFNKKLELGPNNFTPSVIQSLTDDSYISITSYEVPNVKALFMAKINSNGTMEGGIGMDQDKRIVNIPTGNLLVEKADGNYALVYTKHKANDEDDLDVALLVFNLAGDELLKKEYGNRTVETPTFLMNTDDGGFIIGGTRDLDSHTTYFIIRLDSQGEVVWDKTFGTNVVGNPAAVLKDGQVFLLGTNTTSDKGADIALMQIDATTGGLNWTKEYGKEGDDKGSQIVWLAEKGVFFVAGLLEETGMLKHYYFEVDETGKVLRENTYYEQGLGEIQTRILPAIEGNGVITMAQYTNDANFQQPCILRIGEDLKVFWNDKDLTLTSSGNIAVKDIQVTEDNNGYVILGYRESPLHQYGWIASLDYWGVHCNEIGCEETKVITGIEELLKKTKFSIYQSASKKQHQIDYDLPLKDENGVFHLYNLSGEKIKSVTLDVDKNVAHVDTGDLKMGIYLYTVLYKGARVANGKLLIE